MKVDVVMCTWNSNKPYFVKCLDSIKKEIPIHHFILIDRFSKDRTVETVKHVFPNAVVKQSNARLGISRKLGIELVDTEFFVSVDSDMELRKGWFERVVSHLDSRTGAIQGSRTYPSEHLTAWFTWSRNMQARFTGGAFAQKVLIATSKNLGILRGDPSNALIRTYSVKDYNPPTVLSAYEDHLMLRCVVRKGYTWKALLDLSNPTAIHYGILSLSDEIGKGRWWGAGERLIRFESGSLWSLIWISLKQIVSALFASLETKQPMILPHASLRQFARVIGWVNWIKYLDMER